MAMLFPNTGAPVVEAAAAGRLRASNGRRWKDCSSTVRGLHARAARTNPLRGQRALEEIRSRIGTTASRDAVIELEQGGSRALGSRIGKGP
jgi:hypothetical protein